MTSELETNIVSVERIEEYSKQTTEVKIVIFFCGIMHFLRIN